jgi:hypothetical protein
MAVIAYDWHFGILNFLLKRDGQQFHQYQQNEQSPLIVTHWTQKRSRVMQTLICETLHRKLMDSTKIVYLFNISAFKFKHLCLHGFNMSYWLPPISTKRTITSHRNSLNTKKIPSYDARNPGLAWDRHKNITGLNRLMRSQSSLLDNWISNSDHHALIKSLKYQSVNHKHDVCYLCRKKRWYVGT